MPSADPRRPAAPLTWLAWLIDTDWPVLAAIFLVYTQFPERLRIVDADPLLGVVVAALAIRAVVWHHRFGDMRPAAFLVAVYLVVAATSVSWAADLDLARVALQRLAKDLLLFLIVAAAIHDGRTARRAAWTLVVSGVVMTAGPVFQRVTGNYGNDLWGFSQVQVSHLWGNIEGYRVTGSVSDPNYFAQSLLPVIAVGFALLWTARKPISIACCAWSVVAALGCIVLTYSRGAVVGLAVVIPLLVFAFRPWRRSAALVAVLVALALPFVDQIYINRVMTFAKAAPGRQAEFVAEPGFKGRASEILAGLQMFRDRPLSGVGLGNYELYYQGYAREIGIDPRNEERQAHSLPIEVAAETGIFGLIAWGLLLSAVILRVHAARSRIQGDPEQLPLVTGIAIALVGYLTTSLFLHDAYQRQLWIVAALAYASTRIAPGGEPPRDAGQAHAAGVPPL